MNLSVILFGIIPLLAFVLIESFAGLRAGIVSALLLSILEVAYSLLVYKNVDELTLGSTALVLIFGLLSYYSKKNIYLKLQPVFIGVTFSCIFLVMQLMGKPLLNIMFEKYKFMLPVNMQNLLLQRENSALFARLSAFLGWGFLVHAAMVAYCAFRMSTWWWLLVRGIGLYVMLFICTVLVRL